MSAEKSCDMFERVYDIILERQKSSPDQSYVASLMHKGMDSILKKIGEEASEVIIAAKNSDHQDQIHEITDLWFHLMVLMGNQGITLDDISNELQRRFGQSGLEEKAHRVKK